MITKLICQLFCTCVAKLLSVFLQYSRLRDRPPTNVLRDSAMNIEDIPALAPPAGVNSNFDDPVTMLPAVYGVAITSIILMTIAVGVRIYTKAFVSKQMRTEDCKTTFRYVEDLKLTI